MEGQCIWMKNELNRRFHPVPVSLPGMKNELRACFTPLHPCFNPLAG